VSIAFALQPAYELASIPYCLPHRLDRSTEIWAEHVIGMRGARTAALEVIRHGDLDNGDAAPREETGDLRASRRCIPVVENHHRVIERPAFGDFGPDNIVLFNVG